MNWVVGAQKAKIIIFLAIGTAVSFLSNTIANFLTGLASIPILGIVFKILSWPFKLIGFFRWIFVVVLVIVLFCMFILPLIKKGAAKRKKRKAKAAVEDAVFENPSGSLGAKAASAVAGAAVNAVKEHVFGDETNKIDL